MGQQIQTTMNDLHTHNHKMKAQTSGPKPAEETVPGTEAAGKTKEKRERERERRGVRGSSAGSGQHLSYLNTSVSSSLHQCDNPHWITQIGGNQSSCLATHLEKT